MISHVEADESNRIKWNPNAIQKQWSRYSLRQNLSSPSMQLKILYSN
jgi:hypothetical protein